MLTRIFAPLLAVGLSPIIICFFIVILITSSDKSYGFRRLFVKLLLNLFEWASQLQNEEQDNQIINYDEPDGAQVSEKGLDSTLITQNGQIPSSIRKNGAIVSSLRPNKNSFSRSYLIEKDASTFGPGTPIPFEKNGKTDSNINTKAKAGTDVTVTDADGITVNFGDRNKEGGGGGASLPTTIQNGSLPVQKNASPTKVVGKNSRALTKASMSPPSHRPRGSFHMIKEDFQIYHVFDYIKFGMEVIIEDEVTQRFQAEELPSWNLLTRTNKHFYYISPTFTIIWGIGFIFRYLFLLPVRVLLFALGIVWLMFSSSIIGMVSDSNFKIMLYRHASLMCFRILARSLTAIVTFHNRNNRAKPGGICVANHTSPIDVVMLSCDNCYAMVGQRHGGFFGFLQRILSRSTSHVWFERSETQDRRAVFIKMKEHVSDPKKLPILIFPEGTCINNTSVMMFKKGSFEVGGLVYPAAIKYDARFGDPFWNSSRQTFLQYLLMMMTSWALVCDVWYLPPMMMQDNEDAFHFADRVKSAIAWQGGLVDLDWDGELKRALVKQSWKENQQYLYSQRIKTD